MSSIGSSSSRVVSSLRMQTSDSSHLSDHNQTISSDPQRSELDLGDLEAPGNPCQMPCTIAPTSRGSTVLDRKRSPQGW